MNNGELIISLAEQSGIELTDDQTKVMQDMTTEIPGDIAKNIQNSLLTKDSALANPDIINKVKAESLDAVDQKLKGMAMELGYDSNFVRDLSETKGTYKRMEFLTKGILANQKSALEKAKEGATGDDSELQTKIKELNAEILTHKEGTISKTDHQDMIDGYEEMLTENAGNLKQMKIQNSFTGKNWAMDVPSQVNVATAMGLLNSELASKGLSVVDDNGLLKLQTKENSPYFVDNKEISLQDLADSVLASNKLLKVKDAPNTGTTVVVPGASGSELQNVDALATLQKASEEAATYRE